MDDEFIKNAVAYAALHGLNLTERLGYGVHGIVFAAGSKSEGGGTAVKVHRESAPYQRERAVYERLGRLGVAEILGFNVPQFISANDELLVIEMSIVARPFVLDFAGAYLDAPPVFPDEVWEEWEAGKREIFRGVGPMSRPFLVLWRNLVSTWWTSLREASRSLTELRMSWRGKTVNYARR